MGFTPDSAFPLTYAEKGLLQVLIKSNEQPPVFYRGGDSFNAVSASAQTEYNKDIEQALKDLNYKYHLSKDKIIVEGVTAHAKNPQKGISANLHLLEAIKKAGYNDNGVNFAVDVLKDKFYFEGFSNQDLSDFSGGISVNIGKVSADKEGTVFSMDFRLPVGADKENVLGMIKDKSEEYNLSVQEYDWLRPIHVPLDSELVNKLLTSYQEITHDYQSQPYISAGATYARAFDNCVAFGANFPKAATTEHQPKERIKIDDLLTAANVYKLALKKCIAD